MSRRPTPEISDLDIADDCSKSTARGRRGNGNTIEQTSRPHSGCWIGIDQNTVNRHGRVGLDGVTQNAFDRWRGMIAHFRVKVVITAIFFGVRVCDVNAPCLTGIGCPSPTNDPAIVGVRLRVGMMMRPARPKPSAKPRPASRVRIALGNSKRHEICIDLLNEFRRPAGHSRHRRCGCSAQHQVTHELRGIIIVLRRFRCDLLPCFLQRDSCGIWLPTRPCQHARCNPENRTWA